MRFAVILLAIALLAGCGQDQHLGRRLTETQDKLTARVQKIDVSKAPPDLPLPKNPPKQIDIQKVLAESAKIKQLKVVDVVVGSGKVVEPGKYVSVHYVGVLPDGYLFDTSFKGEAQPFTFRYTPSQPTVIDGWIQGLKGMRVGGHRKLTVPASLAYGANPPAGSPIPANAALIFDIQLMFVSDTE